MLGSKALLFLIGAFCIYPIHAKDFRFSAQLLVESNATLDTFSLTSLLDSSSFQVNDSNGVLHTINVTDSFVIAECNIFGMDYHCQCGAGYTWSNQVCYSKNCCQDTVCEENVMSIQPLCIQKDKVFISGSVILNTTTWSHNNEIQLQNAFQALNGFQFLDVVNEREGGAIADFEAEFTVRFTTSKLQDIISLLESSMDAQLLVTTKGIVRMIAPSNTLPYMSKPKLKCTFNEPSDSAGWTISRWNKTYELKNGSMVNLEHSCPGHSSCVKVTIQQMTDLWAGTYECEFKVGAVRHINTKTLTVSLLPDTVSMVAKPLTVDCSDHKTPENFTVSVIATIQITNETYEVRWSYRDNKMNLVANKTSDTLVLYVFEVPISCKKTADPQVISLSFKNGLGKEKTENMTIPVIYEGDHFCREEMLNNVLWPKTPAGATVFNRTCPAGRVGYKSRTCNDTTWFPVFPHCVNEALDNLHSDSEIFLTGLGSTKDRATEIFHILKNNSEFSNSSDGVADINESIGILNVMGKASQNVDYDNEMLPYFAEAASNMVNYSWSQINTSEINRMSSTFLHSVEDLMTNIKVNNSEGYLTENLGISYCLNKNCDTMPFQTKARLNLTSGTMKTVVIKNLMDKLKNDGEVPGRLLISATLEDSNSSVQINLEFPSENWGSLKPSCVFWNTTGGEWSKAGCLMKQSNRELTVCQCNHLTSFSVLMAKSDVSTEELDAITLVGLSLSVASLIVFLLVEFLVWSAVIKTPLSHFRHHAMVNIATFLLLANCSFLASSSPEHLSNDWCLIFTICKHLFFLAMFSWMLCLSVLLVHQLIFVFSPVRKRVFMFLSSFAGYFCPVVIVGSSYVYCQYTDKPYYNSETCWLVFEELLNGSVHAFFIPVGTIILTNSFSLIVVVVTLVKTSAPDTSGDKETAKGILKVMFILTPVFGVTWIIGFFLQLLDEGSTAFTVANYSFTILNSFQGVFILLTGCVLEQKVRAELWKIIMKKTTGNSEFSSNSTLTSKVKDK